MLPTTHTHSMLPATHMSLCLLFFDLLRGHKKWLDKASSLKRRVAHDFSLDETAAARLTLGLGDAHMPGFSLFAMPVFDLASMPSEVSGLGATKAALQSAYLSFHCSSPGQLIAVATGVVCPVMYGSICLLLGKVCFVRMFQGILTCVQCIVGDTGQS